VFERFNEQARQVVVLAQDEARSLGHDRIGSEHLLLGLLRLDDELVELLGDPADARRHVMELVGEGELASPGQMPLTEHAKAALEAALAESAGAMVGKWQLALGLLSLPDDATAVKTMRALGVSVAGARAEILGVREQPPERDDEVGGLSVEARRVLETAARHAEDGALGPEHLLLGLVLEVPELARLAIATADGVVVHERLAGLLDGPEQSRLRAPRRDIAVLEAALREAARGGLEEVTPVEIMLGLLEVAPDVVARASVDLDAAAARTRRYARSAAVIGDAPERAALADGALSALSRGARDVLSHALEEAQRLGHGHIGTEHLLLGLVRDGSGAAGRVLAELHVGLEEARARVAHIVPPEGDSRHLAGESAGQMPFTARMAHIFSLAVRELAVRSGATEVDSGDLLLAIERDGDGVAVQVLEQLGAPRSLVRQRTLAAMRGELASAPAGRLAPSARRALLLAEAEASALGHGWVGCEHLLLALARQEGSAADALSSLGVTAGSVRASLVDLDGSIAFGEPAPTPRLLRSIESAQELATRDGRAQADDGDLLLGLVRESAGIARTLLGPATDEASLRRALGAR
jgi:ATP-dependent Clp protease ATP-binding subunit ClpA